jgi:hypothetical protein
MVFNGYVPGRATKGDVMQWLQTQTHPCPSGEWACAYAAEAGQLESCSCCGDCGSKCRLQAEGDRLFTGSRRGAWDLCVCPVLKSTLA